MNALKQALDNGKFGITAEMAPPKGYDFSSCMEAAELLKDKVHCVNVTDMQSSCLKASSLGLCIKLKEKGLTITSAESCTGGIWHRFSAGFDGRPSHHR